MIKKIKSLFKRKPIETYVPMPPDDLTEAERREIANLIGANEQLSATLKIMAEKREKMKINTARNIDG